MLRRNLLAVVGSLLATAVAPAQAPAWQFRWQSSQVLTYRVQHVMTATEVVNGSKEETTQKLDLVKRWQVLAVDAAGVATVQKSLIRLRIENVGAGGEPMIFDSANPDRSDPQMREQLAKFVGQPLETLCVDSKGKVVAVKESKHGPASRFEAELPFVLTLPATGPTQGQTWERTYTITLEPPQGVGDKFAAVQKYVCQGLTGSLATISLKSSLQSPPEAVADRIPLLPLLPEGEVVFDTQAGRLQRARLLIDTELKDHQGEGSSYRLQSTYTEEYVAQP